MKKILDDMQEKILNFINKHQDSDENITLQYIGDIVGLNHPQKVANKIEQLEKKGFISKLANGTYRVIKNIANDIYYIPIFGFAQCGIKGPEIVNEYPKEYLPYPANNLKNKSDQLIAVKAKGKSMEPKIESGDTVIVKIQDGFDDSNMVLLSHNNEAKIKRIKEKDGKYFLNSLNNNFDDLEIVDESEINIIGIVTQINKKI
ncbi:MAG: S24 family peptidase [Candidatus Absconditabacteria bacterium]|nr:S24 family peptidase [Candidatus Absconditabacteria bacterium]